MTARGWTARLAFVCTAALGAGACVEAAPAGTAAADPIETAEFGVFYGGQVQKLRSVAWPAEGKRPTLGFRLLLREPRAEDLPVRWEVDVPSRSAPGRRVQRVSEVRLPQGQVRLDQPIEVPPGAELGLWNVRVIVGGRLVLDRAVRLYEGG